MTFNVLDRNESIHRHLLLEASAGTGKTFAIENIVVRLLVGDDEHEPLLIENILVVTFTRMAARELKERIHANLEKCFSLLKRSLLGHDVEEHLPDFLRVVVELGENKIVKVKKSIEQALFSFDRAQIFTIHGFCWRMLNTYSIEGGISLQASSSEDRSFSVSQKLELVSDFLRRELDPLSYSYGQLKIISKRVEKDSERLKKDLLSQIDRGMEIKSSPPFSETFKQFQDAMSKIKRKHGLEKQSIVEDCLKMASFYTKLNDRQGKIHPESMSKIEKFAKLFEKETWAVQDFDALIEDGLFLLEVFDPARLKAKAKPTSTWHPENLLTVLKEQLEPIVSEARNEAAIFSRLASECQQFLSDYQKQEELFGHNDLLIQMGKAIEHPPFVSCIRKQYQAAIIDEFQDTDPIQWEIFSTLFATSADTWKGHLAIVGDPKQSIYAFRQADIYTYLRAADRLGSDALANLDTNFRSQPSLVKALNVLFSSAGGMFSLPKISDFLSYRTVVAGRTNSEMFDPKSPSLHFWEVKSDKKATLKNLETQFILPAIVKEIIVLHEEKGMSFGKFAILIADRFQAQRVSEYLHAAHIPVKSQKGIDLSDSSVIDEMRDLLNGVMNFHSRSHMSIALAGRLIGMNHMELHSLKDEEHLYNITRRFNQLKSDLSQLGFSKFFQSFMASSWHLDGKTVLERLLGQLGGLEFYREWQDLSDLMIAEEQEKKLSAYGLVAFLNELESSPNDDDRLKVYVDPEEEGVAIMTTHVSKGLEFDIVFALGVMNRNKLNENKLIPLESDGKWVLGSVKNKEDPHYLKFCEESDAEKMRQLYVALTRARERLYIPFVIEAQPKEIPFGTASPMELFLAKLGNDTINYSEIYQRIAREDGLRLKELVNAHPEIIHLKVLSQNITDQCQRKEKQSPTLIEPKQITVPGSPCFIQSFTSLTQNHSSCLPVLKDHENNIPHDFFCAEKSEHTLPSGNETGVLLHKIFELLPYDSVKNMKSYEQLKPQITPFLKNSSFALWEDVIAKIVFNSLKVPIGTSDAFCLAEVKRTYREMEFFMPCKTESAFQGIQAQPGFLKGVVDLFFEHQGKYYLLDWKSNWLGPSHSYYTKESLEGAMRANHYELQAKIYGDAVRQYLKIFDQRPFEEFFGGVYYFFVRGVSETTGVLHLSCNDLKL